ncbi:hypothetical protein HKD51_21200 [Pseudomonas fragi]|nr:hypothetical protein [Pseudomonas sp. GC01]
MESDRIFTDIHLPGGPRLATNPSNTDEENRALDKLFGDLASISSERDTYQRMLAIREDEISEAKAQLRFFRDQQVGAEDDNKQSKRNTDGMNEITREELSRTLSAIEERMDKRIERMEKESERSGEQFRSEMLLRDKALHREMALKEKSFRREHQAYAKALDEKLGGIEGAMSSAISEIKGFKLWMAGIGIAVVLGIMGANATIFGGGKAFFDGGKDSVLNQQRIEALIEESQSQTEATKKILEEIRARQESLQHPASVPAATPTAPKK